MIAMTDRCCVYDWNDRLVNRLDLGSSFVIPIPVKIRIVEWLTRRVKLLGESLHTTEVGGMVDSGGGRLQRARHTGEA